MEYPLKISTELNEKSILKAVKFTNNKDLKNNPKINKYKILIYSLYVLIFFIFFLFCLVIYLLNRQKKINQKNNYYIENPYKNSNELDNNNLIEPYIKAQKDFCENPNKYFNKIYENEICLYDVKFNELKYQIYAFKSPNFLINELKSRGHFEKNIGNNMIEALNFYRKNNAILNNKDIIVLDIGGNVGWYPSLLGRYGYTIISFEAFEKNYYVEKKNFCLLNNHSNIIIVPKGLGIEEKICHYFNHKSNPGNGMVICDNKDNLNDKILGKAFIKESEVEITTLNYFIPYLCDKNVALIKLDVEGNELQILKGGSKLITKYHVPFVVLEFSPSHLKEVGSEPRKLAEFFVDNGYKISLEGFLSKNYITVDELLNKTVIQINCYFIHNSMS